LESRPPRVKTQYVVEPGFVLYNGPELASYHEPQGVMP
jgi:hypothetical protein